MTLIIEDGSVVDNANSYVTLTEARAYGVARGETLPTVDAELEALLIKSMDYLEGKRSRYQGYKVSTTQSLQWPRYGVYIDCNYLFPSDEIPDELKSAQNQLAIDQNNGVDIQPNSETGFIIEEKVGPITTKYSEKVKTSTTPTLTVVEGLLAPLYNACGQGAYLKTLRV